MKATLRAILYTVAAMVLVFFLANVMLSCCSHTAWSKDYPPEHPPEFPSDAVHDIVEPKTITLDENGIAQLRMFKKEIARLQYTEFCATVKELPAAIRDQMAGMSEAAQKGDKQAQAILMWLVPIIEKYEKAGCRDA